MAIPKLVDNYCLRLRKARISVVSVRRYISSLRLEFSLPGLLILTREDKWVFALPTTEDRQA